jgi:hypothetical protein
MPAISIQKERALSSLPKRDRFDIRAQSHNPQLFWVRREVVLNKSFLESDCYPAGRERLPTPLKLVVPKIYGEESLARLPLRRW